MISNAIFPCIFTDGARVIGELSYTLNTPVCTDSIILAKLEEELELKPNDIREKLFTPCHKLSTLNKNKEKLVQQIRQRLNTLVESNEDMIYYGMFTSLLEPNSNHTQKILIVADDGCRIQRGIRQEGLTASTAREVMEKHDRKAACWTEFLFNQHPYSPILYDTVIRYECQDLLDVLAYLFMLHENRLAESSIIGADF